MAFRWVPLIVLFCKEEFISKLEKMFATVCRRFQNIYFKKSKLIFSITVWKSTIWIVVYTIWKRLSECLTILVNVCGLRNGHFMISCGLFIRNIFVALVNHWENPCVKKHEDESQNHYKSDHGIGFYNNMFKIIIHCFLRVYLQKCAIRLWKFFQ